MDTPIHFAAAPWPTALKVSSVLGTLLLVAVGIAAHRNIPVASGFTHYFGLGIAMIPAALLVLCLLFTVTGYVVSPSGLAIQRLFWATRIPIAGLKRVSLEPGICKGSIRIFGNGGLFGFTGLYQNSRIGRYRLFATDLAHSVVLTLPHRTVVITPAAPDTFVKHMHRVFPLTGESTA